MRTKLSTPRGSVLLMVLVLLGLLFLMLVAGSRFTNLRYHQTINQSYREQSYSLADSGVYYALWMLNVAELPPGPVTGHAVQDPVTHQTIGTFDLSFSPASVSGCDTPLTVTSTGKDTSGQGKEQTIVAVLKCTTGQPYKVLSWN